MPPNIRWNSKTNRRNVTAEDHTRLTKGHFVEGNNNNNNHREMTTDYLVRPYKSSKLYVFFFNVYRWFTLCRYIYIVYIRLSAV